jgi:hypothetical protein
MILGACLSVAAQAAVSFEVTTDKTRVALGDQFLITAKITTESEPRNLRAPSIPDSPYYRVVNTSRNQSSSIQIINGAMKKEISALFHYSLIAQKKGSVTFPALTISHEGTTYTSEPFTITIGAAAQAAGGEVSVRVFCGKKNLYEGEQTVLTVRVAHKPGAPINLTDQGFSNIVKTVEETFGTQFAVSRLFSNQIGRSQKRINGEILQVYELPFSLIGLQAGSYTLPAIPFQYESLRRAKRRRVDPFFDDFFGGSIFGDGLRRVPRTAMSPSYTVSVRALPAPPDNFSGAVGSFSIEADISPRTLPAGEAATLKIALHGTTRPGNMGDVAIPELPGFEVFTPEKATSVDTTALGFVTRKAYKYLLIPQTQGEKRFPAITWTYFDPAAREYQTASAGPFDLTVTQGAGRAPSQSRYLTQEDIRQVGRDIRYIKTPDRLRNQSPYPHRDLTFILLYPMPFLLAGCAGLYRVQSKRRSRERERYSRQQALRRVCKEAHALEKKAGSLSAETLTGSLAGIIERYITNRFSFPAAGKTLDELRTELISRGALPEQAEAVVVYLRDLDLYRFGGVRPEQDTIRTLISSMRELLQELEKCARKGKA